MSHPTLATVLEPTPAPLDNWNPRPFKPWWRFLFVVLLALLSAAVLGGLTGCGSDVPAKSWPEVIERHWFARPAA